MPPTSSNRLLWLDWANVLAMLCVVWMHVPSTFEADALHAEYIVVNGVFFALSGVTFSLTMRRDVTPVAFLRRVLCRLYVPALCFFVPYYLLWVVVGRSMAGDAEALIAPLQEFLSGRPNTVLATYWYVFSLMVMQTLGYIVVKAMSLLSPHHPTLSRAATVVVLCAVSLLSTQFAVTEVYQLRLVLIFLPFFLFGMLLPEISQGLRPVHLVGSIAVGATLVLQACSGAYAPMEAALSLLVLALNLFVSIFLSRRFGVPPLVSFLRGGALVLLATQNMIIGVVKVMFNHLAPDFLAQHFVLKPFVVLVVYALTFPLILLLIRYLPFVLGKRKP